VTTPAGAWEGDYVGGTPPAPLAAYADALVWSGVDVGNTIEAGTSTTVLTWSDPIGGSTNDYDMCRLNLAMTAISTCSTNIQNGTQDPVELMTTAANTRIVIVRKAGAAARFMSLTTNRGRLQYATTGQTRGHSAALLGMSVAATPAAATFGAPTPKRSGYHPVHRKQPDRSTSAPTARDALSSTRTALRSRRAISSQAAVRYARSRT
jgi:hypothetical protein